VPTWTSRPQHRQDGAACACTAIRRGRSCRRIGAVVMSPRPPMPQRHPTQEGPCAPQAFPRCIAPTDPAATRSSSVDFPGSPVRRPPVLRRFHGGRRRASPVASPVLVPMPSLPPPPAWSAASASLRRPMLPSPARLQARPPGLRTCGATWAFACATAWRLALIPRMRLSRGCRRLVSRPPALRAPGLWLFPWEVALLLHTPAFAGHTSVREAFTLHGSALSDQSWS